METWGFSIVFLFPDSSLEFEMMMTTARIVIIFGTFLLKY